jgi:hypothetical protein
MKQQFADQYLDRPERPISMCDAHETNRLARLLPQFPEAEFHATRFTPVLAGYDVPLALSLFICGEMLMFSVEDPVDGGPSSHAVSSFAEITHPDVTPIHSTKSHCRAILGAGQDTIDLINTENSPRRNRSSTMIHREYSSISVCPPSRCERTDDWPLTFKPVQGQLSLRLAHGSGRSGRLCLGHESNSLRKPWESTDMIIPSSSTTCDRNIALLHAIDPDNV